MQHLRGCWSLEGFDCGVLIQQATGGVTPVRAEHMRGWDRGAWPHHRSCSFALEERYLCSSTPRTICHDRAAHRLV